MEISLEKIDQVVERTYVSYKEAKEALERCSGDVLAAIIYLEDKKKKQEDLDNEGQKNETVEEFKAWLKDVINKGNVTRIKVKKDDNVIVDVPVNAGIAAAVISIVVPAIFAFGVIAAVATKVTIEITMKDGTVKVVNKYVSDAAKDIKEKAINISEQIKAEINKVSKKDKEKTHVYTGDETIYSYKVNFDENGNEQETKIDADNSEDSNEV